jgi:hypothetical protein
VIRAWRAWYALGLLLATAAATRWFVRSQKLD